MFILLTLLHGQTDVWTGWMDGCYSSYRDCSEQQKFFFFLRSGVRKMNWTNWLGSDFDTETYFWQHQTNMVGYKRTFFPALTLKYKRFNFNSIIYYSKVIKYIKGISLFGQPAESCLAILSTISVQSSLWCLIRFYTPLHKNGIFILRHPTAIAIVPEYKLCNSYSVIYTPAARV